MMNNEQYCCEGKLPYFPPTLYVKTMVVHRHLMNISGTNQPDIDVDNGGTDDEGGAKAWRMDVWED